MRADWCTGFRVVGERDVTYADKRTTWAEAHAQMVASFERWTHDDCRDCAAHAAEQLPALRALQPETEWQGEVEGDDYLIARSHD